MGDNPVHEKARQWLADLIETTQLGDGHACNRDRGPDGKCVCGKVLEVADAILGDCDVRVESGHRDVWPDGSVDDSIAAGDLLAARMRFDTGGVRRIRIRRLVIVTPWVEEAFGDG